MNLSVIQFNARARSGSSNIKPIFNLLPHIVENFLISVCTVLSDPCLELVSVVGSGRGRLGDSSGTFVKTVAALLTDPFHETLTQRERLLRPERHFSVLTNVALPSEQNAQLSII
jgi:hypothetical protein